MFAERIRTDILLWQNKQMYFQIHFTVLNSKSQ